MQKTRHRAGESSVHVVSNTIVHAGFQPSCVQQSQLDVELKATVWARCWQPAPALGWKVLALSHLVPAVLSSVH